MSVNAAPLVQRASVPFAVFTHAVVGDTLAAVVGRGSLGAVTGPALPDVNLLFVPAGSFAVPGLRGLTLEYPRSDCVVSGHSPVHFERR